MSQTQMLINYVPGEECRVAIVEDGKLEELHVERPAHASRVGNIYVGKVTNVEPSIQAAFVDFGLEENGFLHVTDLHPRYFPGEDDDSTERVGFKTPRRERPPIQAALRRGDEIIVQVLKEGVGTKGPTVTSYLSIPGRFLVMMPGMDNVGVSRKVEDEDQRRKMREILDQLELPEGFGFILRTAGMDRTKTDLKRDLAYLQRLWKDMERRRKAGTKPALLYSESDLLVRALRDLLGPEISEVVIDHEIALRRAGRFMKIVSPRGQAQLLHHVAKTPIFHAFGIEQQISLIHAREVPLPSGGRLVIDQTEALVAIDVNSGRSRDSRDSESNAYNTNAEAVDAICRQLRLRDMGGIVICDLIDMRGADHRKDIEQRFRDRLKHDRAKSTVIPISEFGILQLTRQRMRPSHESVHFTDCPTCRGRGLLQRPDSVSTDALRDLAALLDWDKVARVEMVVAPRVAGDLLSTRRQLLSHIERTYAKHVDVRVSEQVALDRVTFYAYDALGADVDVANLPKPKKPKELVEWNEPGASPEDQGWAHNADEEQSLAQILAQAHATEEPSDGHAPHPIELDPNAIADDDNSPLNPDMGLPRKRRRRRGRGVKDKAAPANAPLPLPGEAHVAVSIEGEPVGEVEPGEPNSPMPVNAVAPGHVQPHGPQAPQGAEGTGGRRRRRRRRGRGGRGDPSAETSGESGGGAPVGVPSTPTQTEALDLNSLSNEPAQTDPSSPDASTQEPGADGQRRRRRRRRRGRGGSGGGNAPQGEGSPTGDSAPRPERAPQQPSQPRPTPTTTPPPPTSAPVGVPGDSTSSSAPRPRTLYAAIRRKLAPSEVNRRPKPE